MIQLFFTALLLIATTAHALEIVDNSPEYETLGYGNCNIYKSGEKEVIETFVTPNSTVIDAGASFHGSWSKIALRHDPTITLFTFEPIPEAVAILRQHISHTGTTHTCGALSNVDGTATFTYYPKSPNLSSLYERVSVANKLKAPVSITVPTITLDTFCEEHTIDTIDFLKIDTEGSELDVLIGATELLENRKIKQIQFEYGGTYIDAGITLEQVYNLLNAYGFRIYRITPHALIKIEKWVDNLENFTHSNYFAILNSN